MYLDRPLSSHPSTPRSPSPQPYTDLFGDDTSTTADSPPPSESHDVARLRRTHTTQGYRDGITAGKGAHLQSGFDEGYSLGGRFGLKTGWILGVLDGLLFVEEERERIEKVRREAEGELALEKVFAGTFFDEGGVWRYEVGEEDGGVTLDRVVERHPLVEKWMGRVLEEAERCGLEVGELVHEEEQEQDAKVEAEKSG